MMPILKDNQLYRIKTNELEIMREEKIRENDQKILGAMIIQWILQNSDLEKIKGERDSIQTTEMRLDFEETRVNYVQTEIDYKSRHTLSGSVLNSNDEPFLCGKFRPRRIPIWSLRCFRYKLDHNPRLRRESDVRLASCSTPSSWQTRDV